jgi:hypothetical protein
MMIRRITSLLLAVFLVTFIFTSFTFTPDIELIKKINAMEIIKVFTLPTRTLFYLNRIFTNEGKEIPLSSAPQRKAKEKRIFQFLILSLMSAMLIPASVKLIKPDFIPCLLDLGIFNRGDNRAPPAFMTGSFLAFKRKNSDRTRRCTVVSHGTADQSDDSGPGSPEEGSKPNHRINHSQNNICISKRPGTADGTGLYIKGKKYHRRESMFLRRSVWV